MRAWFVWGKFAVLLYEDDVNRSINAKIRHYPIDYTRYEPLTLINEEAFMTLKLASLSIDDVRKEMRRIEVEETWSRNENKTDYLNKLMFKHVEAEK